MTIEICGIRSYESDGGEQLTTFINFVAHLPIAIQVIVAYKLG